MKYFVIIFLICNIVGSVLTNDPMCKITTFKRTKTATMRCTELTSLQNLVKLNPRTTKIEISSSNIHTIPRNSFFKFGPTLRTLDLHEAGIKTIEPQAFKNLTKLNTLLLWGNKLEWVEGNWFENTYNLRTLDLSFNFIQGIEPLVFEKLPYLENFYFDYNKLKFIGFNMFAYLGNLKKVKFGKNPLTWSHRAYLTLQLEERHIQYTEEWENWGWMFFVIKECALSGAGGTNLNESVLDCAVGKLLDYAHEIMTRATKDENVTCHNQGRELFKCMRPKNVTGNTDNETVRRILEDYAAFLMPMTKPQSPFRYPN